MPVKLGQKVKDSISGFEGIAIARAEWLYGCIRVNVAPNHLNKDGNYISSQWIDEPQLVGEEENKKPAGPRDDFHFSDSS